MRAAGPFGQLLVSNRKREDVHRNGYLPGRAGQHGQQVHFLDARVGDGQAADGDLAAMDEDVAVGDGLVQGALGGSRVVEAQREVEIALGVEAVNFVEALRHLAVAGAALGPQRTRSGRQRVGVQQLEGTAAPVAGPYYELAVGFKEAEQDFEPVGVEGAGAEAGGYRRPDRGPRRLYPRKPQLLPPESRAAIHYRGRRSARLGQQRVHHKQQQHAA